MKINNLIQNKLLIKQKSYIRFPMWNKGKDPKFFVADSSTNFHLIPKNNLLNRKRLISSTEYTNIVNFNCKYFNNVTVFKNKLHNIVNIQYMRRLLNILNNNRKSTVIIKPIKNGFLTLSSNGLIANISKEELIQVIKKLYNITKTKPTVSLLNLAEKQSYYFLKPKFFTKIDTTTLEIDSTKRSRKDLFFKNSIDIIFKLKPIF